MRAEKNTESQGVRLLRQLFLHGKRIFNMRDVAAAAILEKIPHNQLLSFITDKNPPVITLMDPPKRALKACQTSAIVS